LTAQPSSRSALEDCAAFFAQRARGLAAPSLDLHNALDQPAMFSAPTSRQLEQRREQLRETERKLDEQLREIERRAQLAEAQLSEQLALAIGARWSRRVRVTVIPLTLGIATGVAGAVLLGVSEVASTSGTLAVCLLYANVPLTLLSAPANDVRAAYGSCVFFFLLLAAVFFGTLGQTRTLVNALNATPVCGMRYQLEVRLLNKTVHLVTFLLVLAVLLSRLAQHAASRSAWLGWLRPITTRQLTQAAWLSMAITYPLLWLTWVSYLCAFGAIVPAFYSTTLFAQALGQQFVLVPVVVFCSDARVRSRVHAMLAAIGGGVSAAAGVAALIGGQDPQTTISEGRKRCAGRFILIYHMNIYILYDLLHEHIYYLNYLTRS
jgi:hypothetical protein